VQLGQAHGVSNVGVVEAAKAAPHCTNSLQRQQASAVSSTTVCETVEFVDDDDDDDGSGIDEEDAGLLPLARLPSAEVPPPPLRDLAAMLSSDEEDGEDEILPAAAPPVHAPPKPMLLPISNVPACSDLPRGPPETNWYQVGSASERTATRQQQQQQHEGDACVEAQQEGYASWDEEPGRADAPEPTRAIGDGIMADSNFADANWDSD